jgi:hypothetical protein
MPRKTKPQEVILELDAVLEATPEGIVIRESTEEDRAEHAPAQNDRAHGDTGDEEPPPDRLVLVANREIVLQVGKASITLTQAGKIILRGTYVLSRSSGVNRIKGGSVQIN